MRLKDSQRMSVERDEKRPEGWVLGPWGFGGWEEMGGGGGSLVTGEAGVESAERGVLGAK